MYMSIDFESENNIENFKLQTVEKKTICAVYSIIQYMASNASSPKACETY